MGEETTENSASSESALLRRLRDHFGCEPARLPVITQVFAPYEQANLQLAIQELLSAPPYQSELIGVVAIDGHSVMGLAQLANRLATQQFDEGPVEYHDVALPHEQHLACVRNGLYLVRNGAQSLTVLVVKSNQPWQKGISIEVMAEDREQAEVLLREVTKRTQQGHAFRGQILSLDRDCYGGIIVNFHQLPRINRSEVILPEAILARIERHTLTFNRHVQKLLAAGRHLKRGLLFYGPPGTGKTLTAMYLVSQMPGRTVILLTGGGMGSIEVACKLARMLSPATVILEDVDLIGTQRNRQSVDANALLFELLNQMDGLAEDTDVLFLLTTNRPDILELALASRPGRIDQAIEIPPPDADCRRRLFESFGQGLKLELDDWDSLVARTDGVSGSFVKELLRKAAVFAAEDDSPELVIRDRHLHEALTELLVAGGPLTQSLLGAVRPAL